MANKNKGTKRSQRQKSVAKPKTSSSPSPSAPLPAGISAPDFALKTAPDQTVSLREFRNRPVVLVFYPADFSPVCGDEMALFNEILPEFNRFNAQLLGISEDNIWSHIAFSRARNLKFPLLSDFHPKGSVARQYGVYRKEDGTAERALFVIDGDGIIRWSYVSPVGVNPGANGVLAALESLGVEEKRYGK
jgi:peroxiredoxin (alkyl hydroperoxide reductase subunit C)